jgi:cytochrome c
MAGPVYYKEDFRNAKRPFPDYYDGKLFVYEWMRGWIMALTLDGEGNYLRMERFMPSYKFSNPVELEFGPDGDMYMLEYGTGWFQENEDARLVRIEYNGGNRKPIVQMSADKKLGATPLAVQFSSEGTQDFDKDALQYAWKITDQTGAVVKTFTDPNPAFTFDKPGVYQALLTVRDAQGEKSTAQTEIKAGNEAPTLSFDMGKGNKTFYFPNQSFTYAVKVNDKEDGSLENGKISPAKVALTINYLKEGFDQAEIAQGHRTADASVAFASGKKLMEASDCKSCHIIDKKSAGPSYISVAKKYKNDPEAVNRLANKVIQGGGGVWGDAIMPAHPQLALTDVKDIIQYVLSLDVEKKPVVNLPLKGTYTTKVPQNSGDQGVFIVRAAYTDKGANGAPPAKVEEVLVLRNPKVTAATADKAEGIQKFKLPGLPVEMVIVMGAGSHIGFSKTDLTDINQIEFSVAAPKDQLNAAGGTIEIRLDSPSGQLIGETSQIVTTNTPVMNTPPQQIKVKLNSVSGVHDLYYVFKNDQVKNQPLFVVYTVQYHSNGNSSAAAGE